MPDPHAKVPADSPLNYGAYTTILRDDTTFWNMGGNGLVPYGAPHPPRIWAPDLVDMIRSSRAQGGNCAVPPGPAIMAPLAQLPEPAAETPAKKKSSSSSDTDDDDKAPRKED
jgi:hypothetical protein